MLLKARLDEKRLSFSRKGRSSIEPLWEWLNTCVDAEKSASSNDLDEIKRVAEKIVTNPRLLDKRVVGDFARPFELVWECKGFSAEGAARFDHPLGCAAGELPENIKWRGRWDLNPRSPA